MRRSSPSVWLLLAVGLVFALGAPASAGRITSDLGIAKSDVVDPIEAGSNITYNLSVSNAGPFNDPGVVVTDVLPGSVTFESASPTRGS
jgi:uncharacterized repeat protein (TIGR01451 family)